MLKIYISQFEMKYRINRKAKNIHNKAIIGLIRPKNNFNCVAIGTNKPDYIVKFNYYEKYV